jgi:hypothetical protein
LKIFSLTIKCILLAIIFIAFQFSANAQFRITVGGSLGGGYIKGNSPDIGAVTASVFIETNTVLFEEVFPRLEYIFAKDYNAIVPNVTKPYLSWMQGFAFKGVTTQYFDSRYFLEEAVGLLALNDRTFSDTNTWGFGTVISFHGGYDLRGFNLDGFEFGLGVEYGLTFTNTLPQYLTFNFFFEYTF